MTNNDLDNPQRWECGNCGHAFYDTDGWSQWWCENCGEEMHKSAPEGHVPEDELRAFVEELREEAPDVPDGHATLATKYSLEWAADELEELIDDE